MVNVQLPVDPVPRNGQVTDLNKHDRDSRVIAHQSDRTRFTVWEKLAGLGLAGAATAVVVATVVENYLTMGVGVGDDGPSFALASGMLAMALEKLRRVPTDTLPKADLPARIDARPQFHSPGV